MCLNWLQLNLATNLGLICFCWGDENNSKETIKFLKSLNIHGIIYDKMDKLTEKNVKVRRCSQLFWMGTFEHKSMIWIELKTVYKFYSELTTLILQAYFWLVSVAHNNCLSNLSFYIHKNRKWFPVIEIWKNWSYLKIELNSLAISLLYI